MAILCGAKKRKFEPNSFVQDERIFRAGSCNSDAAYHSITVMGSGLLRGGDGKGPASETGSGMGVPFN